ncbi:MAG: alanine--tRNA ligase [Coriobacteriaceae bacterium]|nr:alanine--tRNA ligase [Coriobacteriaceae bacterium]
MKSSEIRERYLAFFEGKGCKRMPSSSLIPDDPSMLLTSAGMVQFKPYFLQQKQLEKPFIGTTTVQKCLRTTDIENIGVTGRHLSFFEMLGNFSFGDYFKQEMCAWAYEFCTEVLEFDPERLRFTVYLDDDETEEIWMSLGIPREHITRLGAEDNFWTAGPTGPCGPSSELYYDQGPEFGCGRPDCAPGCDCDRFLEFWNCVFTQYDRQEDGTLVPLPKKNIDTGMGLERTAALIQGVSSNYETDILRGLIAVGERLSGKGYGVDAQTDLSLRILADHSRAITFMIADGILPSNEGRGYVLRRLLRRAMRHGQLIGIEPPFLNHYLSAVIVEMGPIYPELLESQSLIARVMVAEEERFAQTLRQGQTFLDHALSRLADGGVLDGKIAFELHDRYGFPIDLTVEIAAEQGFSVDRPGFDVHMEEQRKRARSHVKDEAWNTYGGVFNDILNETGATTFIGYDHYQTEATVLALIVDGQRVNGIEEGTQAQVVLDRTPFYGEMGGQVGDTGDITSKNGAVFSVADTRVYEGSVFAHVGTIEGALNLGDQVEARIDSLRRERIQRNHTATHLLHLVLRQVLGEHVKQAGSLVAPDRLRFDFTHFEQISSEQLQRIEQMVNDLIMEDGDVSSYETSLDEARQSGVTALFGEKYGENVRVLKAGDDSRELCGGTHVSHTGQIGLIKILSESSVGANLRRIEAITSFDALRYVNHIENELRNTASNLKASLFTVAERVENLLARLHELEGELKREKRASLSDDVTMLSESAIDVGYPLVVARIDGLNVEDLRNVWDVLRTQLGEGCAAVLGSESSEGTPLLLAAGTAAAVQAGFDAGALIKLISPMIKGGGGGKPTMAQAGGKDASGLDGALERARQAASH